ncbi:MAG: HaeIII family restriction endonuclease [Candidatus Saccharibacteria bacterium]|nr:HaeIII family restriction endonuclease [Candidatus Saccharibacteria bacterium]
MISGKSFEYALLIQFYGKLKQTTTVKIIKNSSFRIAKECFGFLSTDRRSDYLLTASFAVNFFIDIEPRLNNHLNNSDCLQLEIAQDSRGELGDARDILIIRSLQDWEIGISVKNNHRAIKHSRLSYSIDFGQKWLGINVSQQYLNDIKPIFQQLEEIKRLTNNTRKWKELDNHHSSIYKPLLVAFRSELGRLHDVNSLKVSQNLIKYLIGKKDFYKVIKLKNQIEIQAYNFNQTLNLSFKNQNPLYIIPAIKLPTKILDIRFKPNSQTTVTVKLNYGWELSFRIHNASSKVEPSLKFDIQLLKSPKKLFKNHLNIVGNKD